MGTGKPRGIACIILPVPLPAHTDLVGRPLGLAQAEGHEGQRGVRAVHQQELAPAEVARLFVGWGVVDGWGGWAALLVCMTRQTTE